MQLCRKIRIYPTKDQKKILDKHSELCRQLYNVALTQRTLAYKHFRKSLGVYDQKKELPDFKKHYTEFSEVYNKCLSATLFRLDAAFKAFFKRNRTGAKKGYPRYQSQGTFFTLEYPGMYIKTQDNKVVIPTGGRKNKNLFIKCSEVLPTPVDCLYLTKDQKGNYYISVVFTVEAAELSEGHNVIAFDLGIKTLATGADTKGRIYHIGGFSSHKWYNKQLDKIRSKRDKCQKHSRRYKYLTSVYKKVSDKKRNKQTDSLHKASSLIAYKLAGSAVVIGDLSQKQMVSKSENRYLNRAVQNDWGLFKFVQMLEYKCKKAGKELHKISERYTSKTCSRCGTIKEMPLSQRTYKCSCGLVMDRDENSAINILNRYLARLGPIESSLYCAAQ